VDPIEGRADRLVHPALGGDVADAQPQRHVAQNPDSSR
jgi:hypothetical protein